MNKFIGISLALLFIPFDAFALSTSGVIFFYGFLPISLFITALILSLVYSNKDERDEKPVLRASAWIFAGLNAIAGAIWLYFSLSQIYSSIIGESEFRFSAIFFLIFFILGGFQPLYIMFKAEVKNNLKI